MTVRITNGMQMIMSLRDSDFDCYSAYGEVVDNSIQAKATFCRILVTTNRREQRGPRYDEIDEIAFGDDGTGMDVDVLHKCLSLGWSSRYNDRTGIGRFGVGMTLAAIHEAQRVEVYSKVLGGAWRRVHIDLKEMGGAAEPDGVIAAPVEATLPKKYEGLVGSESGTLVLWKNYDRQSESFSVMSNPMKIWLGRTYRKFIWNKFTILLNGEVVKAIDPLYATTELTAFPNDPKAELFEPMTIEWPVPPSAQRNGAPKFSTIQIRMSLLPQGFRKEQGSGGSAHAKERHIDDNEGISILRNGREVFYDWLPHWPGGQVDEKDRWWGCEIEFAPILDESFAVKNIKRGAVPTTELKRAIYDKIVHTIKHCRDEVSKCYSDAKVAVAHGRRERGQETGHEPAQETAKNTETLPSLIDKGKNLDVEVDGLVEKRYANRSAIEKAQLRELFKSQPFTITDADWIGPAFMEVAHLGGNDAIQYNLRHPFMMGVNEIMNRIEAGEPGDGDAKALRAFIDLLVISYAKAESMFPADTSYKTETFIDELRTNWGRYLKQYMETWNKENG